MDTELANILNSSEESISETSLTRNQTVNNDGLQNKASALNEQFRGSAVWIRGDREKGYWGTIGNYRFTAIMETAKEVEDELVNPSIVTILEATAIQIDAYLKLSEEISKSSKNYEDYQKNGGEKNFEDWYKEQP